MKKFILIFILLSSSLFGSNLKTKNILLLHTYDYQFPWTKSLFEGMDIIQKESKTPIKFYTEHINFKKIKLQEKDKWEMYFSNRYKNIPIDGIIVVFGNAIKFINRYGDTIFKNIPKIIYGNTEVINNKNSLIMKIENEQAIEQTVKAALLQNEDAKEIYLLGNAAELTPKLKKISKKYIKKYSLAKIIDIPELTEKETKLYLSKISKNSIILYCLYFQDKNKIRLSPRKYLEKFSEVSAAPIYSYYSVLLGTGTIGGEVIDSSFLMQNMVKILIFEDTNIKQTYSIQSIYDYNILKKFDIDINSIPKNAILINNHINYLKIHKDDIFISLILLFLILFLLSIYLNKKRKNELLKEIQIKNELLHLKEEFTKFFELPINLQLIVNIQDKKIIQINKASMSMLGYTSTELKNTVFLDLVHPKDKKSTINLFQRLSKKKIVYFYENRLEHKEGNYVNLAWSITADSENKLIYATAQNITAYKLIQKEKKEKEKLLNQQSKMATMGEMIGNIAHQWKQPLGLISASNSLLQISQEEKDLFTQKEIDQALYNIENAVVHLSETIDDFRNFFRPDKEKRYFKLNDIHDKMYKLIKSQLKNNSIKTVQNLEDVELYGFPNEMLQVLINIIKNAKDELIKVTTKEKRVILIDSFKKENSIVIKIKDNAGGIKKEIINKIFDAYFTTKDSEEGTGIGLYMSKQIIEGMNGKIMVSNTTFIYEGEKYNGAEFTISLPCKEEKK